MNKILLLTATAFILCGAAFAQDTPPPDPGPYPGPKIMMYQANLSDRIQILDTAGPAGPVAAGGMFFSSEVSRNGKPVTGAPYTATASTEITQILGDGNRIVNNTSASLARDNQGRTRREETMGMVGPWQVNAPKLVFISDPASQTNYVLDPGKQIASVLKVPPPGEMPPLPGPPPGSPDSPAPGMHVSVMSQSDGNVTYLQKGSPDQSEDVKTESLGVQTMEGVSVEGKRTTRTIPAGQIGNVQPIESVSEVWFSPDLQVVVMSKHSDPRFGETIYQLTGIQRAEPDHSLFEVPPGYKIQNMPAPMGYPVRIPGGNAGGGAGQIGIVTGGPAGK